MSLTEIDSLYHPLLLEIAHQAITYGLKRGKQMVIHVEDYSPPLRQKRATFVTLKIAGDLKGCIGTLEAYRSLIEDVVGNAYAAAFSDPRFNPLTRAQRDRLQVSISVLGPSQEMTFADENDLLKQLRPGTDGLILKQAKRKGTFLPAVWESLPDRRQFLEHLKLKADLPSGYWSDDIRVFRYTTQMIDSG
ncbi:MAG: AmmeMemoRadiSam system protein A [Gammaproteobacteria bacterium]|nr:AmmeMemoRadiSam system protein A [Gammaproteobacteria bacterium]